jgi:uncharacterized membrane protein YraQ (UPF0718 family)
VVTGLRKSGASTSSAVAFFLGNPALNPAVLVFLVFTLGWGWAALRLVLALVLVLGTAALAARVVPGRLVAPAGDSQVQAEAEPSTGQDRHWAVAWLRSLVRLTVSLVPEYVILVLALGAFRVFLFPEAGPQLGNNPLVVIGLAIAGALFAIPTAGEIAIIQTMRGFGMGAGPAGALLLSLPAISLPSLVMVWRVFPKRVLGLMLAATIALSILAGLLAIGLGL